MSFVEIALIISATANFFCFYMSKRTSKTIMDLSELNSAGEELLTLERRLLEHERENFERQKEICMLQREVILNLLNAIDKENVKLDGLKYCDFWLFSCGSYNTNFSFFLFMDRYCLLFVQFYGLCRYYTFGNLSSNKLI